MNGGRQNFLVSGFGDGALIDLCRLTIERYRQDTILYELFPGIVDEVEDTIRYIVMFPKGFRSAGHLRLREAPIKPYNILLYRIDRSAIVIIGLFDMRRHPKYLKQLKGGWKKA